MQFASEVSMTAMRHCPGSKQIMAALSLLSAISAQTALPGLNGRARKAVEKQRAAFLSVTVAQLQAFAMVLLGFVTSPFGVHAEKRDPYGSAGRRLAR
jgi:hypothetical protein